jgi:prepilin-type N-terminal cleavage/methylation domain-containing protein/prepilin-type processing-associated H-X9-DG protein
MHQIYFSKSRGFTMVELLVVIAIILFLAALLMPALGRVRETAKMTKCTSNLRQIHMATFMYASDNAGRIPYHEIFNQPTKNETFTARSHTIGDDSYRDYYPPGKWFGEYLPGGELGRMNRVAYCPKGGRFGSKGANVDDLSTKSSKEENLSNISYGINPDLTENQWYLTNGDDDRRDIPLNAVPCPSKVSLWTEATKSHVYKKDNTSGRHFSKARILASDVTIGGNEVYRDYGKANVVFVDGHIENFVVSAKEDPNNQSPRWNCRFWNASRTETICNPGAEGGSEENHLTSDMSGDCPWCKAGRGGLDK